MRLSLLLPSLLLFLTSAAHAESSSTWNFQNQIPTDVKVSNLTTVQAMDEGLYVKTGTEGYLLWNNPPLTKPFDVITLKIRSGSDIQGGFMWAPMDPTIKGMYRLPVTIPQTDEWKEINLTVNNFPDWNSKTKQIALSFPAGSELIIQEISFRHWNPLEKIIEGVRSFWTFDTFHVYSINFVWGPLIAVTTPGREELFKTLPPFAWSATRIFYALLLLAAVIGVFLRVAKKKPSLGLGVFAATFAALWILFDIRMGLEVMSYAKNDLEHYVFAAAPDQNFRTHANMYGVLNEAMPIIKKFDRFALYIPNGSVYFPNTRYMAYPSIIVREGEDLTGIKLFAVFDRGDITFDPVSKRLTRPADPAKFESGREAISPPGHIALTYDDASYLFIAD